MSARNVKYYNVACDDLEVRIVPIETSHVVSDSCVEVASATAPTPSKLALCCHLQPQSCLALDLMDAWLV
jgi:hypothetical protein